MASSFLRLKTGEALAKLEIFIKSMCFFKHFDRTEVLDFGTCHHKKHWRSVKTCLVSKREKNLNLKMIRFQIQEGYYDEGFRPDPFCNMLMAAIFHSQPTFCRVSIQDLSNSRTRCDSILEYAQQTNYLPNMGSIYQRSCNKSPSEGRAGWLY